MRSRFPPLLLLGIIFLASVSVSSSEKPNGRKCVKICESEKDPSRVQTCKLRCKHVSESGEKEEGVEERELPEPHPSHEKRGPRERGHQEGEKKEEEKEEREQPRPFPPTHSREYKREEEQWKGRHRREDPEERERVRQREEEIRQREREEMREREREREEMREREREREEMKERERQREKEMREREKEEKPWRREKKKKWEEIEEKDGKGFPDSDPLTQNNPFHFSSNRFRTLLKNQLGHIRALRMFDQSSSTQLQNLRDYRVVEFKSKPNTLLLPHHANADFLLVVLSGRALINFVKPNDRDPYYLDPGYAQIIPAGTTFYLVNPDRKKNLRVIKLAIPVNRPAKFENFFLSSTQQQQSYLQGFSEDILEASFDSTFEEISKGLFGEKRPQQEGVIVELSNEKIEELSKSAESSSRKTNSFDYEPFDLRSSHPIYSNKFGVFYEITPKKNSLLRELNILLNYVDINKGGLLLPHYNSKAIVILVVNKGEANVELVGPREEEQQKQLEKKEESMEVQRYRAELSQDDVFVIPAAYPVSINATSNLNFVAFGINAENNQRNFLAGEKDNVISEIPRQVLELSFPGSGADVEKLIENQRESYFVDAQPQQNEENGKNGRKDPLSSILGAIY